MMGTPVGRRTKHPHHSPNSPNSPTHHSPTHPLTHSPTPSLPSSASQPTILSTVYKNAYKPSIKVTLWYPFDCSYILKYPLNRPPSLSLSHSLTIHSYNTVTHSLNNWLTHSFSCSLIQSFLPVLSFQFFPSSSLAGCRQSDMLSYTLL